MPPDWAARKPPDWAHKQTQFAQMWMHRAEMWRYVYMDCEGRCRRLNTYMQTLMFFLMALSPATSFASFLDTFSPSTKLMAVGILSSLVMFLRSVQSAWKLGEQAQMFKDTSNKFYEIQSKVKTQLMSSSGSRCDWDIFKDKILESMMTTHSNAPTAYYAVLKAHGVLQNVSDAGNRDTHQLNLSDQMFGNELNYLSPPTPAVHKKNLGKEVKNVARGLPNRKQITAREVQKKEMDNFDFNEIAMAARESKTHIPPSPENTIDLESEDLRKSSSMSPTAVVVGEGGSNKNTNALVFNLPKLGS